MRVRDAFGAFGATVTNERWSWSAISADRNTVVLTWWKDEIRQESGHLVYDMRNHHRLDIWRDRPGNRERIRHLIHARDNCDGLFRIVWSTAADLNAVIRRTISRNPDLNILMRLVELNEQSGEFRAEQVNDA